MSRLSRLVGALVLVVVAAGSWAGVALAQGELNSPPVAGFSAMATGLTAQFTNTSTGDSLTHLWDFGDGNTSTEVNPSHPYAAAGTYEVTLTVSNSEGLNATTQWVTVSDPVPPVASFTANPTSGEEPLVVTFTNQSTGEITTYLWDFGDGGPTSADVNPSHTFGSAGDYTVTLTVTGDGGDDSDTMSITVGAPPVDPTPTPDPMEFAVAPVAESSTSVTMAAVEASSIEAVEYLFEELSGESGGTSSLWQTSVTYTDEGLAPGTTYRYRVSARAATSVDKVTGFSGEESVTTPLPIEPTEPTDDFESGDFRVLPWRVGRGDPWVVQGDVVCTGAWAAASAAGLADGEASELALIRTVAAGGMSFQVRVSSQAGADVLRFFVDGVERGSWSGEVPWTEVAVDLDEGTHAFEWSYEKDGAGSAGLDRAFIDDVVLPPALPSAGGGGCVVGCGAVSSVGWGAGLLLPLVLLGLVRRRR